MVGSVKVRGNLHLKVKYLPLYCHEETVGYKVFSYCSKYFLVGSQICKKSYVKLVLIVKVLFISHFNKNIFDRVEK